MENNNSTQPKIEQVLELSDLSIVFLREVTKWAKFLSIVGFVGVALMVILALFVGVFFSMLPIASGQFAVLSGMSWFYSLIYLVFAAVYAIPVYFLYKFSLSTRSALDLMDTNLLEEGMRFLKSHYKFIGIMTIVMFCLYIMIIVVVAITTAAAVALS